MSTVLEITKLVCSALVAAMGVYYFLAGTRRRGSREILLPLGTALVAIGIWVAASSVRGMRHAHFGMVPPADLVHVPAAAE